MILVGLTWLAGLGLGLAWGAPFEPLWLAALPAGGALIAGSGSWLGRFGGLLAVALVALGRAGPAFDGAAESPLGAYRDQQVTVRGSIERAPRCDGSSCLFVVRVGEFDAGRGGPRRVDGLVQVRTGSRSDLAYGRSVEARGELRAPRAVVGFPRVELLARRGIREVLDYPRIRLGPQIELAPSGRLEALRIELERRLGRAVGGAEGQLAAGLLLGRDVALEPRLREALQASGTSHLLAVSGFNVAVIGGVVLAFGVWLFDRRWAVALATVVVALYTLLVGAPPSAVRAACMFGVAALATIVGRLPDPLTSLVLAAAVMTAVDPLLLLDLGFQLSFVATAGLVLVGGRLMPSGRRSAAGPVGALGRVLGAQLGMTLAAQLATLPLVLYTFRRLSLVAPLANLAVAPLVPGLMGLAALALLVADLPILGPAAVGATWLAAHLALTAIRWSAALPFATVATGAPPPWAVPLAYGCLLLPLGLPVLGERLGRAGRGRLALAGALLGAVGLAGLGVLASARPTVEGGVRALFFDVAGDGLTLLETSSGRRILVGSAGAPLAVAALAEQLPLLDRRIDLLVVGRAGQRDLDGLAEIARRYPLGQVLHPGSVDPRWVAWHEELGGRDTPLVPAVRGLVVDLDGARLEVDDVVEADGERPATLSLRLLAETVDLRVVGGRLAAAAGPDAVVVRLAPELGLSRELRAALAPVAERALVVGGRSDAGDEAPPPRFLLGGAEIVELSAAGPTTTVRRLRCTLGQERCSWSFTKTEGPPTGGP